nr:hypothetical protein [uncultured Butyrivibrio sp.]
MKAKIAKSFKYIRSGIIIELIMMVLGFMVHVINSKTKPDHNWNNFVIECLIVSGYILVFFVTYNIVKNSYRNRKMIFWQEKEDHLDQAKGLLSACRLTFVYFVVALFAVIIFVSNAAITYCLLCLFGILNILAWHEISECKNVPSDFLYSYDREKLGKIGGYLLYNFQNYDVESKLSNGEYALKFEDVLELIKYHKWPCSPWDLFDNRVILVKTDKQEDIDKAFEFAKKSYDETKDNTLTKTAIYCLRTTDTEIITPSKFKNAEFIVLYQTRSDSFEVDKLEGIFGGRNTSNSKKVYDYFKDPDAFRYALKLDTLDDNVVEGNRFLVDFYRNALVFMNAQRSVMALLDYCELILTLSAIYFMKKEPEEAKLSVKDFTHLRLNDLGMIIKKGAQKDESFRAVISKKYAVPDEITKALEELKKYVYIDFSGDTVSFMGMLSLLTIIRNKVIAHGILTSSDYDGIHESYGDNGGNSYVVWKILFWISAYLNEYLRIGKLKFNEENGEVIVGYEEKVSAGDLMIVRNEYPLIASKANDKGRITYVNYFNGDMIVPEFVR